MKKRLTATMLGMFFLQPLYTYKEYGNYYSPAYYKPA